MFFLKGDGFMLEFIKNSKIAIIVFLVLLVGLLAILPTASPQVDIKDKNGPDDYSLCKLEDEDIIKGIDGDIVENHQEGSKKHTFHGTLFSGAETVYDFNTPNLTCTIRVTQFTVTSGNARLVVVADGKIVHDFDLNSGEQTYMLTNFTENAALKIAGESAMFDLEFYIT